MIFPSAGHNSQSTSRRQDPGAIANGYKEGDLMIEFLDLVCHELDLLGVAYIKESKEDNLTSWTDRIKTGSGSVVVEYHMDAAHPSAGGTVTILEVDADRLDRYCGNKMSTTTAEILGIPNKGVRSEADTRFKRLALMKEQGIVMLHEVCFITNPSEVARFQVKKRELAKAHALLLKEFEALVS